MSYKTKRLSMEKDFREYTQNDVWRTKELEELTR